MKKLLLAAAIAVGGTTVVSELSGQTVEAQAKEKTMSKSFANQLKKGTLPDAKGKVNMKFSTLEKKYKRNPNGSGRAGEFWSYDVEMNYKGVLAESYAFYYTDTTENSKVAKIMRTYDYLISEKSVQKHFGKPIKKNIYGSIYKVGKYYMLFSTHTTFSIDTDIEIGTKKAIVKMAYK